MVRHGRINYTVLYGIIRYNSSTQDLWTTSWIFKKLDILKNGVIAEDFQCPICTDVVTEPVMLRPCQHMFCTNCIEGQVANAVGNDMKIICCPY